MGTLHAGWTFLSVSAWSPTIVFALLAGIAWALRLSQVRLPWRWISAALLIVTVAGGFAYLLLPTFYEDTESCVAAVTALLMRGAPLYQAPDAAPRYTLSYGPMAYLTRIPLWWIFGKTIFAFKLTGFLAFLGSLAGLYRICRHYAQPGAALVGVGACGVVFFRYMPMDFWGRGDPILLCMMVLCVWAVLEAPGWAALLVVTAAVAVLPNVKITAGLYLLPVMGLLYLRRGIQPAVGAAALGAGLFCLPYLSSQISIPHYWFSLNTARHHGMILEFLLRNLQYGAILLAPVLALAVDRMRKRVPASRDQMVYLGLIALAMTASSIVGSKNGAGSYHLLPCMVPIVHLYFWMRGDLPAATADGAFGKFALAWMLAMLLFSTVQLRGFVINLRNAGAEREEIAAIRRVETRWAGQGVEMGIGQDFFDLAGNFAAVTTFDGEPFTISGSAVRDMQYAGTEMPDSTIEYMEKCGTPVWLVPAGNTAFSAPNPYFGLDHAAFSERFRKAFQDHYEKTSSERFFDVWSCRTKP